MQEPSKIRYKQVIVVCKNLNMAAGKLAAQAGHGVQLALMQGATVNREAGTVTLHLNDVELSWLVDQDYTKICVSVNSETELLALHQRALETGLRCALVIDNGRTVFKGVKTPTVLAIGPAEPDAINALTGKLPLV